MRTTTLFLLAVSLLGGAARAAEPPKAWLPFDKGAKGALQRAYLGHKTVTDTWHRTDGSVTHWEWSFKRRGSMLSLYKAKEHTVLGHGKGEQTFQYSFGPSR